MNRAYSALIFKPAIHCLELFHLLIIIPVVIFPLKFILLIDWTWTFHSPSSSHDAWVAMCVHEEVVKATEWVGGVANEVYVNPVTSYIWCRPDGRTHGVYLLNMEMEGCHSLGNSAIKLCHPHQTICVICKRSSQLGMMTVDDPPCRRGKEGGSTSPHI